MSISVREELGRRGALFDAKSELWVGDCRKQTSKLEHCYPSRVTLYVLLPLILKKLHARLWALANRLYAAFVDEWD